MGKVKKHSGLSKVLKVRKSGTITLRQTGLNHKTGKKSGAVNRAKRKNATLSSADYNRLKKVI
ncbi:MAG: 50S ribosomal protein L35 [Bacilli bacterium]|nr:50S ribosomal protein L35 [Bacilli bacterium]